MSQTSSVGEKAAVCLVVCFLFCPGGFDVVLGRLVWEEDPGPWGNILYLPRAFIITVARASLGKASRYTL